jgi:hypothetical protein
MSLSAGRWLPDSRPLPRISPLWVDFYWNATGKTFERRNGAVGVLVDLPFEDITLANCMTASYGVPITGVDGSKPIIGCYRTSESHFGKFFVSNWDLTGKLTIDWLTWR